MTVPICRPYIPALLLGPGDGPDSARYNTVLDSIAYVKIAVPNKLLGSAVCIKNAVLVSTPCTINTVLFY